MMKYLLTLQIEKDILHLSISLGNKPMALRFSQNMLHPQCQVSPFGHFYMACNHFKPVLECESTSCPSARTQGPGAPPPPLLSSQGLHSLQLEYVCCWLCGRFWMCSKASGAGKGFFPTTHVAAIKRRKGPCSRGPLLLPALSEIPQSRCYSNWTHFQSWKEGRKGGGILPAAPLHSLFKWWIMTLNIFLSIHFSNRWHNLDCTLWDFFLLLSAFFISFSDDLIIKKKKKPVT